MSRIALKTAPTNYFDSNNEKIRKKAYSYNRKDLGRDILEEAKKNLKIDDSKSYKILLKLEKGLYKYVDLDSPLDSMKLVDNTCLIVVKEEDAVKINLNGNFSRTILLSVTLPLYDILKSISNSLHYKCQYNQYSIWHRDKEGKLAPLNSNLSIAEQTQDYRILYFRRRYFLVFAPDFAELNEAKHIYRDMKQQYLEGLTYVEIDQAVQLTCLMMYADFEIIDDAKEYVQKISNDPEFKYKSLIPKNHGKFHTEKFKTKFLSTFKTFPPMDQFTAIDKFIRESRTLKNFGDEYYKCFLTNKEDGVKCHMYIGPHGIQLMDKSESKEIEKVHILKIKSFKQKKHMLNIKFKDDKNNDKSITLSIPKIGFITTMLNDSISFIQSYYNSELEKQRQRAIGVSDEIKLAGGQYCTLDEAEQAIDLFKAEIIKFDEILYENYGLLSIDDIDKAKIDDYTRLNEIDELKKVVSDLDDILLKNMPNISILYVLGNSVKRRLKEFLEIIKVMRINSHEIKYKEIKFKLPATINYLKSIEVSFPNLGLSQDLKSSFISLNNLNQVVASRYEKKKTQDISDLVSVFVDEFNKIITEIPTIVKNIEKKISDFPQLNQYNQEKLSNLLPKGQLSSIVLLDNIIKFFDYSYSKRDILFNASDMPSYQKFLSSVTVYYPKIYQFANDLVRGTIKDKKDINDRFKETLVIFNTLNPFIVELNKTEKISDEVKNEFKSRILQIVKIFDILKCCSIGQGGFIESKLYTGTHSGLVESIDILPQIESTLNSLLSNSISNSNPKLKEELNNSINYIKENSSNLKSNYQKIKKDPFNTEIRFKTGQILQKINYGIHSIFNIIQPHKSDIQISDQFASFFKCIDHSLHLLSPENCGIRRVDICINSFEFIVEAIDEKHITNSWIEQLKSSLNEMKELYSKLIKSPTDGVVLARLHDSMILLLRYTTNIQEDLVLQNHRTIPLIIEICIPNILRSLEDPLITDEYERCEHLICFNQMQFDLRQLISLSLTLISRPNITCQNEIFDEITNHIKVLQQIYIECSSKRHDLLANPYAYSLAFPILNMMNHLKMTEANMIDVTRKIDDINMNYALKKCLCQSMISITDFVDSANKIKLRPYRKLFTVKEITDYRMNIINLVAFIKNAAIDGKGKNAEILEKESKQFMKFMVLIQKELKQPTHNFDFIVIDLNKYLNGICARCNFPEFTSKRDGIQKVDLLQQHNDNIISGQKPTPTLLGHIMKEMIDNMNSLHNFMPKKGTLPKNIQDIVEIWDKEFQALIPKLKPFIHDDKQLIQEEQIPSLKSILLNIFRKCPELPSDPNGQVDNETLNMISNSYLSLDDCVNLTRQFPIMSTISLDFQLFEVSLAQEIQELGEVILEQFQTMTSLFTEQIIPHRIVQKSEKLTEFITPLSLFFSNNYSLLNEKRSNLEQFIEQFCRDIQLTLQVINKNVQILNPILTTDSLLVSCDALQQNVAKVINQFDKRHMTNQTASEFIKSIVPDCVSLRDSFTMLMKDPLISNESEFIQFLNEASNLINEMEKELPNIKPSQLQKHCDKIYEFLGMNIPSAEKLMDEFEVYIPSIKVYNNLMKYSSLDQKKIYITEPLVVKKQVISHDELTELLNNEISNISNESSFNGNKFAEYLDKLIDNKQCLPSYITTMIKYLLPHISKSSKLTQIIFIKSLLCLSMTEINYDSGNKQIQNLLIETSCLASSILDSIRTKIEEIDKLTDEESMKRKTIHQKELLSLLNQIDTTTLTQLRTIPAFLLTYTNYKQVSFLLPLVQPGNKEFKKVADSYINIMNEVNLLLANNIMILFDHLINSLEIQDRNLDFVYGMVELLHNRNRGVTFDLQTMGKASDLYIKFEASNSAEISRFAMSFDKMAEAKNLIQLLNQYKPILVQWASTTTIDSSIFVRSIQSPVSLLLNQLEKCQSSFPKEGTKVPLFFSLPREEINQIIFIITQENEKKNGTDCTNYTKIAQSLECNLNVIDRNSLEIFSKSCFDKANKEFNKTISEVFDNIKKLDKEIGPIEIEKKEEIVVVVVEEEEIVETQKVVEQQVVKIDTFNAVLDLYNSINDKKYEKASEILDLLRENIDNYEDLEPLRHIFEDTRMFLDFNQTEELEKEKKKLATFLNDKINWQTKITTRASSPSGIVNELIELQRQANEIANQYLDSSDRKDLLTKMAKITADSQALVVYSFKFYKKRTNNLYLDLYQNSVQVWTNILSLFENSSDDSIKRCFRSIRRLLADLSYIPDDLSYINSRNDAESNDKSEFSKALSIVLEKSSLFFNDTALVISLFADSPIRDLYDINIDEPAKKFNSHLEELKGASQKVAALNNRENAGETFSKNRNKVEKVFAAFCSDVRKDPSSLKKIITTAQSLHVALQSMCASTKNLSDVAVRHPDYESVSKLPARVTMPTQKQNEKNDEVLFKDVFNGLQKLISENENKNKELKNLLFESSDVKNDEIADNTNNYIQFIQNIVSEILLASNTASNISIGENLAASASLIVINLENFNKAIKGRFLLKKDWGNDVNSSLDSIMGESQKVFSSCQKEIELYEIDKKQKDDEKRALRTKLDNAGASLRTSRTNIEQYFKDLNSNPNSNANYEWAKELCNLALNSSASLIKVVVFLSDHPSEILTDADKLLESAQKVPNLTNDFIAKVKEIISIDTNDLNSLEFETQIENAANMIKTMAETLNPHFSPSKNADGQVIENTIEEIVKGAEQLADTARNMKKTKAERIEARKKRQEAIEERKKALGNSAQSGKTQEQLIKRLDLESKIIQTRMAIDFQKAKIDALE